jgi:hypothetical protein
MHPDYVAELARVQGHAAEPAARQTGGRQTNTSGGAASSSALRVGDRVQLTGGGKYGGLVGTIEKRGRSRYQVRTSLGVLSVPFTMVEPIGAP